MNKYLKKFNFIVLFIILFLAGFLRLYQLGINPPSLDWDEASLGYNAYSLLKTGRDEFGRFLPVSIRSFEDYKPALYSYLTVPAIVVFGLNEFSVRLPSAIAGILTVLAAYFLAQELFNKRIALLTSFLLAISPWHLQFSRVAFESNLSILFVTAGLFCFFKARSAPFWLIGASMFFAFSFYSYHSPRLVVPLIILGLTWYFRTIWVKHWKWVLVSLFIFSLLLIPFISELVTSGKARFSSVTVLRPDGTLDNSIKRIDYDVGQNDQLGKFLHNRRFVYATALVKGYLDHYNFDFLFLSGDSPERHHARDMGMLYIWEFPFVLLGLIILVKKKSFPILWWFLVAPVASAFTTGTPHAVRALTYLPIYQIIIAVALYSFLKFIANLKIYPARSITKLILILIIFINIFYYFTQYYIHTPVEASRDWQYGYKQAINEVAKYEDEVNKIIITYAYDQPHVFVLFYRKIDPEWYQKQWLGEDVQRFNRAFGKYEFRKINWNEEQNNSNSIVVGTPNEIPDSAPNQLANIRFLDGTIAFRVVKL